MDLITHAAVGAAAAAAIAPANRIRIAAAAGALAGLLPDADILISSADDPLLNLEYHRHFSHSLAFVPFGACIAALAVWLLDRRRTTFLSLYAYAFTGYLLSPLLDACTSYGTHLLWPFSERPVAWNLISVFDPVLTTALLIPLLIALSRRRRVAAHIALGIAAAGLGLGWLQHDRAERLAWEVATSRGHVPERLLVKPTLANLILWRSLYVHRDRIYVDAVRVGLGTRQVYRGESAPAIDPDRDIDLPPGSRARTDLARFARFADALLVRHPERPRMIGDARYAMLPTSLEPLWGILIDTEAPEAGARFETNRRLDAKTRNRFIDMLLGR